MFSSDSPSIFAFRNHDSKRYITFFANTGLFLTAYGFLQGIGKDPISWVITYNPFITTLGNPNFTSAILGLTGIAVLYLALASDRNFQKAIYVIGLILTQYILYRSGSVQGLFGFAIGATIVITVKLWLVKRGFGLASATFAVIAATALPAKSTENPFVELAGQFNDSKFVGELVPIPTFCEASTVTAAVPPV